MASSLVNEQTPLTDNQRDALESMHEAGRVTGVTSVYWELIDSMGVMHRTKIRFRCGCANAPRYRRAGW